MGSQLGRPSPAGLLRGGPGATIVPQASPVLLLLPMNAVAAKVFALTTADATGS